MKIIAIDSSGLVATLAIATEDSIIAEYTVNHKKTHSQTLLPMLAEISGMTQLDLDTVDAIAIAAGPGSFTGLRIGSATAKGLGLAMDKPIIEVPTVDALAMNMWGVTDVICPIMDARRSQVYTGLYEYNEGNELVILHDQYAEDIAVVVEEINGIGRPVVFLGDGVPVYRETIEKSIKVPVRFAPPHMSRQRAGALAWLAVKYYKEGRIVSAADHKPQYLRPSQAEREMSRS
ncbi:MAG: tRNA (adenosine(37)-N6)-threonylcarbamoyltransferase complex dimerization subunit type 1 TsaB [Lachnospiraceae bacterium]|nr:tRNA (adenosine(37)-N6)-threonylcarbamoyltransferase complex dimerization subunit type 1 TsaB [Lachnospiraceae bacterium]